MKALIVFCLIGLVGCATQRGPASLNGNPVAYDSMAFGNIHASAVKRIDKQNICFDITVKMKGVNQDEAQASNWTVAWVDQKENYRLLSMNQRVPASTPQGGQVVAPYGAYQEWNNSFTACSPGRSSDVKSLVLTPKATPYSDDKGMKLSW